MTEKLSELQEKLDTANAELEYYKSLFATAPQYPLEFKLTPDETKVLNQLRV